MAVISSPDGDKDEFGESEFVLLGDSGTGNSCQYQHHCSRQARQDVNNGNTLIFQCQCIQVVCKEPLYMAENSKAKQGGSIGTSYVQQLTSIPKMADSFNTVLTGRGSTGRGSTGSGKLAGGGLVMARSTDWHASGTCLTSTVLQNLRQLNSILQPPPSILATQLRMMSSYLTRHCRMGQP